MIRRGKRTSERPSPMRSPMSPAVPASKPAVPAVAATTAVGLLLALAGPSAPALSATAAGQARASRASGDQVRVDQVGYAAAESKRAYLMTTGAAGEVRFTVVDRAGRPVLTGR